MPRGAMVRSSGQGPPGTLSGSVRCCGAAPAESLGDGDPGAARAGDVGRAEARVEVAVERVGAGGADGGAVALLERDVRAEATVARVDRAHDRRGPPGHTVERWFTTTARRRWAGLAGARGVSPRWSEPTMKSTWLRSRAKASW